MNAKSRTSVSPDTPDHFANNISLKKPNNLLEAYAIVIIETELSIFLYMCVPLFY
jgi:hypothetical protein